ncbi:helix-turn-helix domain-containing protein [Williamsia herbipolensis]|uniref:helix-turn-helix domain-containing protein n=1 Tax=Williamsia herbipolensis TaxID=1603258 RepID=UPI0038B4795F
MPTPLRDMSWLLDHLGISQTVGYALVRRNEIPHVRIGQAIRFDENQIQAWVDGHPRVGGR